MFNMTVQANSPGAILASLGNPRSHPHINDTDGKLQDGDYVVSVDGPPGSNYGAIYVMRPDRPRGPETYLDGCILGALDLLGPRGERAEKVMRSLHLFAEFEFEWHEGREMDGVTIPFFVLRKR